MAESRSPNIKFMFKVVFTYCLGLHLYKKGIRRNNKGIILSSMHKLSALFYGLDITQYMEIDLRHKLNRSQCPPEVNEFVEQCYGLSQFGPESKCKFGDYPRE